MGIPVEDYQFQMDYQLLVSAGSDTTRNVVATGMAALFEHPGQHRALVADPSLTRVAVEEMLRWSPPIVYQRRTATRDAVIGDHKILAGPQVVSSYGAANRRRRRTNRRRRQPGQQGRQTPPPAGGAAHLPPGHKTSTRTNA